MKARLLPFEQEQVAAQELRAFNSKLLNVRFSVTPENDGYKISLSGMDAFLDWSMIPKTRTNPHLVDALKTVNRMRVVKGLKISELTVTPVEAQIASQHDEIDAFVIEHGNIETKVLTGLRPLTKCRFMLLNNNKLTSFSGCIVFSSVEFLDVSDNPLGDDGLESLVATFPKIRSLNLRNTSVSDEGMKTLGKLKELSDINLRGTRVTGQGALKLLDCPNLSAVDIDKAVVTEEQRAVMRKQRPNYSGFIQNDGIYRWGGDW